MSHKIVCMPRYRRTIDGRVQFDARRVGGCPAAEGGRPFMRHLYKGRSYIIPHPSNNITLSILPPLQLSRSNLDSLKSVSQFLSVLRFSSRTQSRTSFLGHVSASAFSTNPKFFLSYLGRVLDNMQGMFSPLYTKQVSSLNRNSERSDARARVESKNRRTQDHLKRPMDLLTTPPPSLPHFLSSLVTNTLPTNP